MPWEGRGSVPAPSGRLARVEQPRAVNDRSGSVDGAACSEPAGRSGVEGGSCHRPGPSRPTDRRRKSASTADRPALSTGAHASHEIPVCRSCDTCDPCDAWEVTGRGNANIDACARTSARGPNPSDESPAPMVATKPRRVARGRHARHGNHGRPTGQAPSAGRASGTGAIPIEHPLAGWSRHAGWPTRPVTPYPGPILRSQARR
jgi:hypothetical protein